MLTPYNIKDYSKEFNPIWAVQMPDGCPPEEVLVPSVHPFYRLAKQADAYNEEDFKSYAEADPAKNWGEQLPLAVGLSVIDNEKKARKNLKLLKGIIALTLNPADGVVKQTGVHRSHYTWWRTSTFQMSNLKMLQL